MNVKFKRKGKNLSTKMEFIMVFTNFNLATDFQSSIITYDFAMACICTLMELSQIFLSCSMLVHKVETLNLEEHLFSSSALATNAITSEPYHNFL